MNTIVIRNISIKLFRSIEFVSIEVSQQNFFVGLNDVGKSNILKALNLFFNSETDYGQPYNFQNDFSKLYSPRSKRAREISIELEFEIPDTFKEPGLYVWRKAWRHDGEYEAGSFITKKDGSPISRKSKVPSALKRINYRYVPAVKEAHYYKSLNRLLYKALAKGSGSILTEPTNVLSDTISDFTKDISNNVLSHLNLHSILKLPNDLESLFFALEFETRAESQDYVVPLSYRGDGIQARHIPIVLRSIAEAERADGKPGQPKACTIWGFEEPENGLEMSLAYEMANEFREYSDSIQMFITTHSPAFYISGLENNGLVFYASKNTEGASSYDNKDSTNFLHKKMGAMILIEPFVNDYIEKNKALNDTPIPDVNTILVEGVTDKLYLTEAIKCICPDLTQEINEGRLRIIESDDGASSVGKMASLWAFSQHKNKLYVLVDCDDAGQHAISNLRDFKDSQGSLAPNIKWGKLQMSPFICELNDFRLNMKNFQIEHLIDWEIWLHWKENNCLSSMDCQKIVGRLNSLFTPDMALNEIVDSLQITESVKIAIQSGIPIQKKTESCNVAITWANSDPEKYIGFVRTIDMLRGEFL